MKKIIIILIGFVNLNHINAQECVNEVSTDPENEPSQAHLEALPQNNNLPDERFLNGWNWIYDTQDNYRIFLNNMGQSDGSYYGSTMMHFNHSSSSGYYEYLNYEYQEVILPENGWELIANNRGWYPDDESEFLMDHGLGEWTTTSDQRSIPYLIFYNKYTGVARIFARYGNNQSPGNSINASEISLYHKNINNGMSGMLRLADGYDNSLDEESLITKVSAIVPSPGNENLWFSTDFQLAYDPCVCEYESQIEASFRFLNESELSIHGAGFSIPVDLFEDDNLFEQDFLNTYDNSDGVDNGYMIYKEMESMINDYFQRLLEYQQELAAVNIHNVKVDANVALLEIAKVVFQVGGTGITAVTGMPQYSSLIGLIPILKDKSDKDTFGPKTQKEFWKQLDKALGMGFDLLMKENFTKKAEPQKPSMPTATATEMRFSGSITHSTPPFTSKVINTPGSKNANSNGINLDRPQRYPIYNEALGVFALLEKPKIEVSNTINSAYAQKVKEYIFHDQGNPQYYPIYKTIVKEEIQFKLKEELKYLFNPALSIDDFHIDASIIVKPKLEKSTTGGYEINQINVNDYTEYHTYSNNHANIESLSFNLTNDEKLNFDEKLNINSPFIPLNTLLSH